MTMEERMDIEKGVWFLALMFYSFFSVSGQEEPSVTLKVSPNNTMMQQDGTTVSLLCQVYGFDAAIHVVSWVRVEPTFLVIATDTERYADNDRYLVSFTEDVVSIMNLTFLPIEMSDSGTYRCILNRRDGDGYRTDSQEEIVLPVYPKNAFPLCFPNGPAAVSVGSQIACITSGIATPSINDKEADEWTYYSDINGSGAVISKPVTSSDNSQTYVCVAEIPDSDTRLSCTIGPLIVVSVDSETTVLLRTTTLVLTSTHVPTASPCDINRLSPVGIAGYAVGVLVILVTIVVNLLCCRYDASRWQQLLSTFNTKTQESSSNMDTTNLNIRSELRNNKQDGTEQHSYANVVVDTETSSQPEGETNCICTDQSLSQGGVKSLKSTRSLSSYRPDGQGKNTSSRQADPYMELNVADQKPALYTELKL